jgi:starvation-inducible DNA-binding protein
MITQETMPKSSVGSKNREQILAVLNKQVANWTILYTKLHNFHWFVQGEAFFTLHQKFEELYTEAADHLDALAERVLTLQGRPLATLKEALQSASVQEAAGGENARQMAEQVIRDFDILTRELEEGIRLTDGSGDEATGDLLLSIQSSLQKHQWMLRSFLGQ